jgi:hypothetical protein
MDDEGLCTCPCADCGDDDHSECYCVGTDDDMPQCPHCEQRYDLTGGCDGDALSCGEQFLPDKQRRFISTQRRMT